MNLSAGDDVVLVGRRRRAAYASVEIVKQKKSQCGVSANLAANLRLRNDDTVKVVPLSAADHDEARSGDLVLLLAKEPPAVTSVTFSPIEDSLESLQASEGGDEISDEELMQRFVTPYTEDGAGALVKRDAVITLTDENGKHLDFIITHVELEGDSDEKKEEAVEGTTKINVQDLYVMLHGTVESKLAFFKIFFCPHRRRRACCRWKDWSVDGIHCRQFYSPTCRGPRLRFRWWNGQGCSAHA